MIAATLIATCLWANPGHNPYQGNVPAAVDRYTDIPADVRQRLKARMERRQFDDFAAITRDSIKGAHEYADLRSMHFGKATVCSRPDRSMWTDKMVERGLVYCEAEHCVIVPTVCRNVSRVTRLRPLTLPAATPPPAPGIIDLDSLPGDESTALEFDPPGAGLPQPGISPAPWSELSAPQAAWRMEPPPPAYWHAPRWHSVPVPAIPEPSTLWLAAVGLAVLIWKKR